VLGLGQRLLELEHLLGKVLDDLFVLLDGVLDVLETLSQYLDEFERLTGDLIIVVLHLLETLGVVLHEVIAVLVLALLNLVDLHLHPKFKLLLELLQLGLVVRNEILLLHLEVALERLDFLLQLLLLLVGFRNIVDVLTLIFVLFVGLHLAVRLLLFRMMLLLLFHFEFGFHLLVFAIVKMIVVKMLHLLHVRCDLGAMVRLFLLHLRVEVLNFSLLLLDLSTGVVIEIVDHILLDLEHVTLNLGLLQARTQAFNGHLQLVILHLLVMIIGLGLVLSSLLLLSLLSLLSSH